MPILVHERIRQNHSIFIIFTLVDDISSHDPNGKKIENRNDQVKAYRIGIGFSFSRNKFSGEETGFENKRFERLEKGAIKGKKCIQKFFEYDTKGDVFIIVFLATVRAIIKLQIEERSTVLACT